MSGRAATLVQLQQLQLQQLQLQLQQQQQTQLSALWRFPLTVLMSQGQAAICNQKLAWTGIRLERQRNFTSQVYLSKAIQFCLNNGGYLAELSTAKKDTEINSHLHKDRYYWIGLKRTGPNKGQGHFLWQKSGKRPTHSLWWKDFMEPNGNGNCVFKDAWEQDDPRQFGWADFDCNLK